MRLARQRASRVQLAHTLLLLGSLATYSGSPGASTCIYCPSGTFDLLRCGSSACATCSAGQRSLGLGLFSCSLCALPPPYTSISFVADSGNDVFRKLSLSNCSVTRFHAAGNSFPAAGNSFPAARNSFPAAGHSATLVHFPTVGQWPTIRTRKASFPAAGNIFSAAGNSAQFPTAGNSFLPQEILRNSATLVHFPPIGQWPTIRSHNWERNVLLIN